ncbi:MULTISPECIES: phage holin family protein [unclassified Streptomyces]|uniref:phage holin family protein n=1 Tax=unclassified Streptomyces TaxID=2593676 RepID=UPI002E1C0C01
MDRLDHLEHLDKHLVDELAQVARETVRDELRQQTRKQRRTATLYAASGALALYAGAALALALGLALSLGLPDWAAALITAVVLGVAAYALRGAARPSAGREGELAADRDRVAGGTAPGTPPGGTGPAGYPPVPPVAPGGGTGAAGGPAPGMPPGAPPPAGVDPEDPRHRGR